MHVFGSLGLGCLGLGFLSALASVVMKYTTGPGMTENPLFLIGAFTALTGVQLLSLGLIGEVLARVYFESQGKRPYTVRDRRNLIVRGFAIMGGVEVKS